MGNVDIEKKYGKGSINSELYSDWRTEFDEFFESERYFFDESRLRDEDSLLDIGCASGGLGKALQEHFSVSLDYTGIDPDDQSIEIGRDRHPDFELLKGYFPEAIDASRSFDWVTMMALFPQIPDWKNMLLEMVKFSRRYINFACILRETGPTIVDKDVSYFYYYDSGERIHNVVHNIYEILNFCCIEEMKAKTISIYGYHAGQETSSTTFRPLPRSEQIHANILIERFDPREYPGRIGGVNDQAEEQLGREVEVFEPEINVWIDDEAVELR